MPRRKTSRALVTVGDGNFITLSGTPGPNGQIVSNPTGGFDVELSYDYTTAVQNSTFGVFIAGNKGDSTGGSTTRFAVPTSPLQITPEIDLDATDVSTVTTTAGGAMFNAAQSQYMTEPDNATLDRIFNGGRIHDRVPAPGALDTNRNFLSKWNWGSNGSLTIGTGLHRRTRRDFALACHSAPVAGVIETTEQTFRPASPTTSPLFTTPGRCKSSSTVSRRDEIMSFVRDPHDGGRLDEHSLGNRPVERAGQLHRRRDLERQHLDRRQNASGTDLSLRKGTR